MSNDMGSVAMDTPHVSHAIHLLLQSDLESLEHYLASNFAQQGAALFADQLAFPMIEAVGNLWQQGRLPVYAEHLFSSMLQKVALGPSVRQGQTINPDGRVLLASPAGETHTLALVLLNAVLDQAGISTVFLQGGLPASEIAAAAAAFKVQVVALSVSRACPAKLLTSELRSLRALLDARAELWIGGEGTHRISAQMDGVVFMPSIKTAVQALKNKFGYVPNLVGLIKDHNHG
jgi:methylmalonyl-CoA mutase cobalamin-binding subunit